MPENKRYRNPPALRFTPSPEKSHPIMVTPQRQESNQNILFKVNYNTPKSRSSTQTSTVYPELKSESALNSLPSMHQQNYQKKYSNQDSNIMYNTPKSRSSTQSSTTSPDYVVVKVKDRSRSESYRSNHENAMNINFVTPTYSNEQSSKNIQYRRRYTASHEATTSSTLISNSASPSRKMLPTYDPRQSKKLVNLKKDRYVKYEYDSGNDDNAMPMHDSTSESYQHRPMFMTPLPVQLTPKSTSSTKTTIRTFTGTLAGPTPPTTAQLRQRTRIIRKLKEKRQRIKNKKRNLVTISVTRSPQITNPLFQPSPRTPIKPYTDSNRRMIYDVSIHKKPALTFLDDPAKEIQTATERMGAREIHRKGYYYPVPTNQLTYPSKNHDKPTKTKSLNNYKTKKPAKSYNPPKKTRPTILIPVQAKDEDSYIPPKKDTEPSYVPPTGLDDVYSVPSSDSYSPPLSTGDAYSSPNESPANPFLTHNNNVKNVPYKLFIVDDDNKAHDQGTVFLPSTTSASTVTSPVHTSTISPVRTTTVTSFKSTTPKSFSDIFVNNAINNSDDYIFTSDIDSGSNNLPIHSGQYQPVPEVLPSHKGQYQPVPESLPSHKGQYQPVPQSLPSHKGQYAPIPVPLPSHEGKYNAPTIILVPQDQNGITYDNANEYESDYYDDEPTTYKPKTTTTTYNTPKPKKPRPTKRKKYGTKTKKKNVYDPTTFKPKIITEKATTPRRQTYQSTTSESPNQQTQTSSYRPQTSFSSTLLPKNINTSIRPSSNTDSYLPPSGIDSAFNAPPANSFTPSTIGVTISTPNPFLQTTTTSYQAPNSAPRSPDSIFEIPLQTTYQDGRTISPENPFVNQPSTTSYSAPTTTSSYSAPATTSSYNAPTTTSSYNTPTTTSSYIAPTTKQKYVDSSSYRDKQVTPTSIDITQSKNIELQYVTSSNRGTEGEGVNQNINLKINVHVSNEDEKETPIQSDYITQRTIYPTQSTTSKGYGPKYTTTTTYQAKVKPHEVYSAPKHPTYIPPVKPKIKFDNFKPIVKSYSNPNHHKPAYIKKPHPIIHSTTTLPPVQITYTTPPIHLNLNPSPRHHPEPYHHQDPHDYDYDDGNSYYDKEDSLAHLRTYIQSLLDNYGLDKHKHHKPHRPYQPVHDYKYEYKTNYRQPIVTTTRYAPQHYPTTTVKSQVSIYQTTYPPHIHIAHEAPKPYHKPSYPKRHKYFHKKKKYRKPHHHVPYQTHYEIPNYHSPPNNDLHSNKRYDIPTSDLFPDLDILIPPKDWDVRDFSRWETVFENSRKADSTSFDKLLSKVVQNVKQSGGKIDMNDATFQNLLNLGVKRVPKRFSHQNPKPITKTVIESNELKKRTLPTGHYPNKRSRYLNLEEQRKGHTIPGSDNRFAVDTTYDNFGAPHYENHPDYTDNSPMPEFDVSFEDWLSGSGIKMKKKDMASSLFRKEKTKQKFSRSNARQTFSSLTAYRPHHSPSNLRSTFYYLNLQRTNGTWAEQLNIPERFNQTKFLIFKAKSEISSDERNSSKINANSSITNNQKGILKYAMESVMSLVGTAFFPTRSLLHNVTNSFIDSNKTHEVTNVSFKNVTDNQLPLKNTKFLSPIDIKNEKKYL